jgi:hypothetical protein
VRVATSSHLTTCIVLGLAAGLALAAGIAISLGDRRPAPTLAVDISAPAEPDLELAPSSSSVIHEPPAPPEGPFYASLFVAGKTWDLPCGWDSMAGPRDEARPSSVQRCRVESVEVAGQSASARIACWYVEEGKSPHPAVNTYVMTPTGLYKATTPSTEGEPLFTPHPIPRSLPRGWGYEEPRGPTWADAMVWHHGAWCAVEKFESLDYYAGDTECISRNGIAGSSHTSMFMTERCGDAPE